MSISILFIKYLWKYEKCFQKNNRYIGIRYNLYHIIWIVDSQYTFFMWYHIGNMFTHNIT